MIFKQITVILNCNNISQLYSVFDQINALQSFVKFVLFIISESGRGVPVSFWAGWGVCSVRSSCCTVRRHCRGNVPFHHAATEGLQWLHSSHTLAALSPHKSRNNVYITQLNVYWLMSFEQFYSFVFQKTLYVLIWRTFRVMSKNHISAESKVQQRTTEGYSHLRWKIIANLAVKLLG